MGAGYSAGNGSLVHSAAFERQTTAALAVHSIADRPGRPTSSRGARR
ncbi:hypothetical protein FRACA_80010 [Frankia canadensis]|uniref:Uncharacterized protein n=1 Tax=Frankia canadensis TaxID=1836972 RepID=A0A2I2L1B9_9ACTN|nr:hypothetical protein FRACA_80010 [Frankia canadensis]SOU59000.1 hypothetical protein FRACA_80010 [Frankia canadensis]